MARTAVGTANGIQPGAYRPYYLQHAVHGTDKKTDRRSNDKLNQVGVFGVIHDRDYHSLMQCVNTVSYFNQKRN
jgi:hypothetical protein